MTGQSTTRIAKRLKIFEPAFIQCGRASARVHLLDLSYTGALVHGGPTAPPSGTFLRIHCKDLDIAARVAWVRGPKFGVEFLKPLFAEELAKIIDMAPTASIEKQRTGHGRSTARPALTANLVARLGRA